MLKEQESKEENLMKFSFIQGCKEKFFQRRNICAQIGSSNRACVCMCVCVCTCRERKYEAEKKCKVYPVVWWTVKEWEKSKRASRTNNEKKCEKGLEG